MKSFISFRFTLFSEVFVEVLVEENDEVEVIGVVVFTNCAWRELPAFHHDDAFTAAQDSEIHRHEVFVLERPEALVRFVGDVDRVPTICPLEAHHIPPLDVRVPTGELFGRGDGARDVQQRVPSDGEFAAFHCASFRKKWCRRLVSTRHQNFQHARREVVFASHTRRNSLLGGGLALPLRLLSYGLEAVDVHVRQNVVGLLRPIGHLHFHGQHAHRCPPFGWQSDDDTLDRAHELAHAAFLLLHEQGLCGGYPILRVGLGDFHHVLLELADGGADGGQFPRHQLRLRWSAHDEADEQTSANEDTAEYALCLFQVHCHSFQVDLFADVGKLVGTR